MRDKKKSFKIGSGREIDFLFALPSCLWASLLTVIEGETQNKIKELRHKKKSKMFLPWKLKYAKERVN